MWPLSFTTAKNSAYGQFFFKIFLKKFEICPKVNRRNTDIYYK